jgi:hypothetical protein
MASRPSYEPGRAAPSGSTADETTARRPAGHDQYPTSELPEADSGSGWPDGDGAGPRWRAARGPYRPGRGLRGLAWLAGILAVLVVAAFGLRAAGVWPHLSNPFASKTSDRSQPALLLSMQDLSRFDAAGGNFQVIVDLQKEHALIPDLIFNQRTLFLAAGTVDAYVDFGRIGQGDVTDSADHRTATIRLPAPQLDKPNLDHSRSQVIAVQEGIVNRIGDLFNNNPNKENELYRLGEQKIAQAAQDSGLAQRAADNTRRMLQDLLRSLGYTAVTITFAAS